MYKGERAERFVQRGGAPDLLGKRLSLGHHAWARSVETPTMLKLIPEGRETQGA
jgi:hypothetical protein